MLSSKTPIFRRLSLLILPLMLLAAGLFLLAGCRQQVSSLGHGVAAAKYHCPMHPNVTSDKPGSCTICGMDLVPIAGSSPGATSANLPRSGVPGLAVVSIPEQKRQLMGMKLATIERRPLSREIRTSARIVADETRLWRVTTKTEGWVERLFIAYTGQAVKKGDPLLTIYSPDLVSAQAEYLAALRAQGNVRAGSAASGASQSLVSAARRRLELWDISDEQVERLARTGQVEKTLTLYAPASGVVLERNVLAGQKLMLGSSLMVIADLSVVWGDADIYQSDLPYIKEGMPLEMSLPYWPDKVFKGKLIFISPTLDDESRTLRARLEIPNDELLLKPGMFGDSRLCYELGEKLSIPTSAVMVGGERTYAFRDLGNSHVVPVPIRIGSRSGDRYELIEGLNEGDNVVASANFLVDSESNLKAALESLGGVDPAEHQHDVTRSTDQARQTEAMPASGYESALRAYLRLQDALASDDLSAARERANELEREGLGRAAAIAAAKDLAEARLRFKTVSDAFIATARKHGSGSLEQLYVFQCSMANDNHGAGWLQSTAEIRNPYFGAAMLKCGENKERIALANRQPDGTHAGHN